MYAALHSPAGNQPFNDWFTPDTTQRFALGTKVAAVDPFWGWGEFVYGKASGAIAARLLCMFDELWQAVGVPSTALQGFPCSVAMSKMATATFGWFMVAGYTPIAASATVAADANVAIVSTGTLGASVAGKQLVNARNRQAQTATKALTNVQTTNGSGLIVTNGYDGWFCGIAITGTGIPASSVAAGLDPDGRSVRLGSAIGTFDKTCTATGSVTATGTFTGFTLCQIAYPMAQGAIT